MLYTILHIHIYNIYIYISASDDTTISYNTDSGDLEKFSLAKGPKAVF